MRKLSAACFYMLTIFAAYQTSGLCVSGEPTSNQTKLAPTKPKITRENPEIAAESSAPATSPASSSARTTSQTAPTAKSTSAKASNARPKAASANSKAALAKPASTKSSAEKSKTAKPHTPEPDEFELAKIDLVDTADSTELKKTLASKIRFCDELILGSAVEHMVAPWSREDKRIASETLEKACTLAPGLMKRALRYGPITVYRAGESTDRFAQAYPPYIDSPNTELVLASKFFEEPDPGIYAFAKIYPRRLWTCIHELSHLADAAHKVSGSPEWLKILPKLLAAQRRAYKMGEIAAYVCWSMGVPSKYTGTNEREALAEYTTALVLIKGKTNIDADVDTYIKKNILSSPNGTDGSVPLAFDAYNFFARKNASIEDLQKAIDLFSKALAIDPQYLHAQYGRQLAEMRLEALKKSQTK